MPMANTTNISSSQLNKSTLDTLIIPLIQSNAEVFKRILQEYDNNDHLSKKIHIEESSKGETGENCVTSLITVDNSLVDLPRLDQLDIIDIEALNKQQSIDKVTNYVQFNDASDDEWEPYNGCKWNNESGSINLKD